MQVWFFSKKGINSKEKNFSSSYIFKQNAFLFLAKLKNVVNNRARSVSILLKLSQGPTAYLVKAPNFENSNVHWVLVAT